MAIIIFSAGVSFDDACRSEGKKQVLESHGKLPEVMNLPWGPILPTKEYTGKNSKNGKNIR